MPAYWHPDGVEDFVAIGTYNGADAVARVFEEIFEAVPDGVLEVKRVISEGDLAAVQSELSGTFSGGPFLGLLATGKRIALRGTDYVEFEDGLIRRNTVYYDGASFARDIGMLPPQNSPAERALYGAFNALTRVRRAVRRD